MLSVMIVASSVHWSNGLFATSNGIELPLLYARAPWRWLDGDGRVFAGRAARDRPRSGRRS